MVTLLCAFMKDSLEWKTPQLGHTGIFIKVHWNQGHVNLIILVSLLNVIGAKDT